MPHFSSCPSWPADLHAFGYSLVPPFPHPSPPPHSLVPTLSRPRWATFCMRRRRLTSWRGSTPTRSTGRARGGLALVFSSRYHRPRERASNDRVRRSNPLPTIPSTSFFLEHMFSFNAVFVFKSSRVLQSLPCDHLHITKKASPKSRVAKKVAYH